MDNLATQWGNEVSWRTDERAHPHEAHYLKLDCSKAGMRLNWQPTWELEHTLNRIVAWHKAWLDHADMHDYTMMEINDYMHAQQGE